MAVTKEIAEQEVKNWLDFKKVSQKKRDTYKENIEVLTEAIQEGYLVLEENNEFVQTLKFPTEGELPLSKLTYKPRIKVEVLQMHLQGAKSSDTLGMMNAYIAALTTQPKNLIKVLDTEDYSVANSIAIFFM